MKDVDLSQVKDGRAFAPNPNGYGLTLTTDYADGTKIEHSGEVKTLDEIPDVVMNIAGAAGWSSLTVVIVSRP